LENQLKQKNRRISMTTRITYGLIAFLALAMLSPAPAVATQDDTKPAVKSNAPYTTRLRLSTSSKASSVLTRLRRTGNELKPGSKLHPEKTATANNKAISGVADPTKRFAGEHKPKTLGQQATQNRPYTGPKLPLAF
jgi:hypothetical protein